LILRAEISHTAHEKAFGKTSAIFHTGFFKPARRAANYRDIIETL
jgi:hypothetical protein